MNFVEKGILWEGYKDHKCSFFHNWKRGSHNWQRSPHVCILICTLSSMTSMKHGYRHDTDTDTTNNLRKLHNSESLFVSAGHNQDT